MYNCRSPGGAFLNKALQACGSCGHRDECRLAKMTLAEFVEWEGLPWYKKVRHVMADLRSEGKKVAYKFLCVASWLLFLKLLVEQGGTLGTASALTISLGFASLLRPNTC